ncbi:hypothetical protein QFZ77_007527 [Paenibacillus sp. V4I3]|uniref:hypothetical protein n=1 Tax=Paenibacillus sp. V4I3 TaxID=3042305 RepID=UPI0027804D6A|nr:hypothetical protein [Paenibacillus sp. V4I3]MDQ0878868.1 hypothetical protein [Paenibacillus sp. V4I3]
MRTRFILTLCVIIGILLTTKQSAIAHPFDENTNKQDSIEWIAFWDFPHSREGQLERMLTTELQRRTLFALQEKKYLKPGKEFLYSFEPFEITNMKKGDDGFFELIVFATVHEVINNEKMKAEAYQITFKHNYNLGFVVTECSRIKDKK